MAQTRRKRRTKHRGTAAGTIEARGRTGRPPTAEERKRQTRDKAREQRLTKRPTWKGSFQRALVASAMLFLFFGIAEHHHKDPWLAAAVYALLAMALYIPVGYYFETFLWRRRMAKMGRPAPK